MGIRRLIGTAVTIGGALFIAYFTLRPGSGGPPPSTSAGYLVTDVILNIILFLPLGVGLALLGIRPAVAIAIGCLASSCIELTQLWYIPGRFASIHDVITNTTGTAIAAMMVSRWSTRAAWWRVLAPFVAGIVVAAWVAGSFLIQPASPRRGPMYSQWGYEFGGAQFTGQILSLSLEGVPLKDRRLPQDSLLRALLARSDTVQLATTFVSGPIKNDLITQIVSIIGGQQEEFVGVWHRGREIHTRVQLETSNAWLRNPWIGLANALPEAAGDTVRASVLATRKEIVLTVSNPAIRTERVRLTPVLFWSGLLPFEYVAGLDSPLLPLLPALPTLVLLGLATHRRVRLAAATTATALILGPLAAGISLTAWPATALCLLSVGLGMWLGRRLSL